MGAIEMMANTGATKVIDVMQGSCRAETSGGCTAQVCSKDEAVQVILHYLLDLLSYPLNDVCVQNNNMGGAVLLNPGVEIALAPAIRN